MAYDLEPTTQHQPVPYQEDDLVPGMSTVLVEAQPERPVIDRFDVVLRGYERHQVDDHVMRMAASEAHTRAELAASSEREMALAAELAQTKAELERGRPTFDALGERVSQMLGLAETEAEQLRSDAARDTAELRETAAKDAADIRSDARRDAEELGAAARRELGVLKDERMAVLTDISVMRDRLNDILGGTTEQWPSLAPAEESGSIDLTQPSASQTQETEPIDLSQPEPSLED